MGVSCSQPLDIVVKGGVICSYSEEESSGEGEGGSSEDEVGSTISSFNLAIVVHLGGLSSAFGICAVGSLKISFTSIEVGLSFSVGGTDVSEGDFITRLDLSLSLSLASTLVFNDSGGGGSNDNGTSESFHDVINYNPSK